LEVELGSSTGIAVATLVLHDLGLVHWHGEFVLPTLAATRANELAG
jgi:hypothetical protein